MSPKGPVVSFRELIAKDYFETQKTAFAEACHRLEKRDPVSYRIANTHFRIHSAGSLLKNRWFRAIEHLRVPEVAANSWNIYVWDDTEAGWTWRIPEPDFDLKVKANFLNGVSSEAVRVFHQDWLGIYSAVNRETREAFYVPSNVAAMPTCERAAPMRTILNFLLNEEQFQMVHAAAIADRKGNSLLLPGQGMSGKSTTAIEWLTSGHLYQGDDLCAIGGGENLETLMTYQSAKMRELAVPLFPSLHSHLEHLDELGEKKALFHLDDLENNPVAMRASPIGILLPKVTGRVKTTLTAARPMDVMRAVIPHSVLQVPRSDNRGGQILLDAIARLPAHHVELGTDRSQLIATLEGVFEQYG